MTHLPQFRRYLTAGFAALLLTLSLLLVSPSGGAMAQPTLWSPKAVNLALFSFSGQRPDFIGVQENHLAPCPQSPNCVSSAASDLEHGISALSYTSSPAEAMAHLKQIVQAQDGAEIITEQPDYLYAEYTSPLMGFVDDVEFYLNPDNGKIDVRSASRLGESDLGVNRKRIETITAKFQALDRQAPGQSVTFE